MKSPIEMMLDGVQWIAIEDTNRCYSQQIEPLPRITHTGLLKIGDLELFVVQLSIGQRVIPEAELIKFFRYLNGVKE